MRNDIYQIYFELRNETEIYIPRFGQVLFRKGLYVYTGSGGNNVIKRINRHLKRGKNEHWHIDFVLPIAKILLIKIIRAKSRKTECQINLETQKKLGGIFPVKRFGSTDCRDCPSHLLKIT